MLYSTMTNHMFNKFGYEGGVKALAEAGFPAIDCSLCARNMEDVVMVDDFRDTAHEIRGYADKYGVVFNQAHAPFANWEPKREVVESIVPMLTRSIEFASILGAKTLIVHPVHQMPHYKNEKFLFDFNVDFYKRLAPYAKEHGIKIAIENMWHPLSGMPHKPNQRLFLFWFWLLF